MTPSRECNALVTLYGVLVIPALASCAAPAVRASVDLTAPEPSCYINTSGSLIVYSATYPQTLEQSEYPAHTNYTVFSKDRGVIEHIANNKGPFGASPAAVELPCGQYRVRAQYGRGRWLVVPIAIYAGKTTLLDLDAEPLPSAAASAKQPIRLPGGEIAGWRAVIG